MRICCSTAKDQRHNHFVKALLCLSNGSGWHAWYDRRLMLGCEATNKAYDSKINNKYRFEIVRISYRYVKRRIWQNLNSEQKLVEKNGIHWHLEYQRDIKTYCDQKSILAKYNYLLRANMK